MFRNFFKCFDVLELVEGIKLLLVNNYLNYMVIFFRFLFLKLG